MNWTGKVVIQGITDAVASHAAALMQAYGTNIVAGISPGCGGKQIQDIPVFDLVEEAVSQLGEIQTSLIFVEPDQVLDAALEAKSAGIQQIIITVGGVPPLDMVKLLRKAQATNTFILGPGSAGIIIPEKVLLGRLEPQFFTPGKVGIISYSDILTYEVALELNQAGLGQSMVVSLGNNGIIASTFGEWLPILTADDQTQAIILIGQPNSNYDESAWEYLATEVKKPVIVFIPGIDLPEAKIKGDAATIIANQLSYFLPTNKTVKEQITAFEKVNVVVGDRPSSIPDLVKKLVKSD